MILNDSKIIAHVLFLYPIDLSIKLSLSHINKTLRQRKKWPLPKWDFSIFMQQHSSSAWIWSIPYNPSSNACIWSIPYNHFLIESCCLHLMLLCTYTSDNCVIVLLTHVLKSCLSFMQIGFVYIPFDVSLWPGSEHIHPVAVLRCMFVFLSFFFL